MSLLNSHIGAYPISTSCENSFINLYQVRGACGVRYHFVICAFPLAETEKLESRFLLGRVLNPTIWNLFDSAPNLIADLWKARLRALV